MLKAFSSLFASFLSGLRRRRERLRICACFQVPTAAWIEELARRGVVAGCGGGNYCPQGSVTREAMAVYLLVTREGTGYTPPACTTPLFNDVPASSPFCRWIEELARRGIVGGLRRRAVPTHRIGRRATRCRCS